ncbi:gp53-like domain-containing protein [Undibacterium sp. MH2W]|uniref:gp53-like domain-containing protein n=1 Tax=Undibacterium sp. MH2W TaxID=3413044 RepID=UPI003BF3C53F
MDRQIVYPGAIPLETDLLNTNKFSMIGLAKLAAALLGTSTTVNGFTCVPMTPANMSVQLTPGEIYSLAPIDSTPYSSLPSDATHQILKQGILMDAVTLACPAPSTSGFSINYLIQVQYSDSDTNQSVLPYYNASNPSQAYAGPSNSGVAQNTIRKGVVSYQAKAGLAAATGSQVTPTADSGYTGLFVVTVTNGQASITSSNIALAANAPFIISNAVVQSLIAGLAPLNSPNFINNPTAPTPALNSNNTAIATTAFVKSLIASLFSGSLATNGYMSLNGFIVQLCQAVGPSASGATSAVTFPISFPNNCFNIQLTIIGALGLTGDNGPVTVSAFTNSGCTIYSTNDPSAISNVFVLAFGN